MEHWPQKSWQSWGFSMIPALRKFTTVCERRHSKYKTTRWNWKEEQIKCWNVWDGLWPQLIRISLKKEKYKLLPNKFSILNLTDRITKSTRLFLYCSKAVDWNVKKCGNIDLQENKRKIFEFNILMSRSNDLILSQMSHTHTQTQGYFLIACKQMECWQMKNSGPWELKEKNSEEPSKHDSNF